MFATYQNIEFTIWQKHIYIYTKLFLPVGDLGQDENEHVKRLIVHNYVNNNLKWEGQFCSIIPLE